jgi:carbon monoxide dehydrogenase subunit G
MKLEGDYLFDAPMEEVWKALLDPVVLAATMPGCEKLDLVDGQYQGDLHIKVGPIQGKFSGKVDLKDISPPSSYTMLVDGRGAPGFVKASALVKLDREGEQTRLRYDADAQVGGKIASVGQRLLEASARAITKQSLEGLHENIKIRVAAAKAASPPAAAEPVAAKVPADGPSANEPSAPSAEAPEPKPPTIATLRKVDQAALAASIAKEVTKSLLPMPVVAGVAIGVLLLLGWLLVRR